MDQSINLSWQTFSLLFIDLLSSLTNQLDCLAGKLLSKQTSWSSHRELDMRELIVSYLCLIVENELILSNICLMLNINHKWQQMKIKIQAVPRKAKCFKTVCWGLGLCYVMLVSITFHTWVAKTMIAQHSWKLLFYTWVTCVITNNPHTHNI